MKRILTVLVLVVAVSPLLHGCSGVIMNAEYSQLLDRTAALSAETSARAEQGKLTPQEMQQALSAQAQTWRKFKDAKDGKVSASPSTSATAASAK